MLISLYKDIEDLKKKNTHIPADAWLFGSPAADRTPVNWYVSLMVTEILPPPPPPDPPSANILPLPDRTLVFTRILPPLPPEVEEPCPLISMSPLRLNTSPITSLICPPPRPLVGVAPYPLLPYESGSVIEPYGLTGFPDPDPP